MKDPQKILVIRDGRLGDLLMITPALRALKRQWPDAELHVLASRYGSRILGEDPWVDQLHGHDRDLGLVARYRELRKLPGPYDLLIALESSTRFAQLARFVPAHRRLGFSNSLAWLYDRHLPWDDARHAILNNLELVKLAGVSPEHCTPEMELVLPEEDLELADLHLAGEGFAKGDRFALLHAPCGPTDTLRPWPTFYYAELADRLQSELGCRALINGSPDEAHIVDSVVAQTTTPVLTNTDPSLGLMLGLIARSSLFVAGDTGPLHMASALGRPLIGLYGCTDPADAGPLGVPERQRFLSESFPCSPCAYREVPEKEACLAKGIADCMVALSVDRVLDSCRELLGES